MTRATPHPQKLITLLLVAGVVLWAVFGTSRYASSLPRARTLVPAIVLCCTPPFYRRTTHLLDRLRQPSRGTRPLLTFAAFVTATTFLIACGLYQHRELIPKVHDEHVYLLQMQMLARGHLWMPAHPAADSFESFYIFTKPVYAGMYFPGTALMYVPAVWLHLPYWLLPALVAGACVAMFFLLVLHLLDDAVYAAMAALLLVSLAAFRYLSLIVMSHSVMLLLVLLLVWSWLQWRRNRSLAWAVAIGVIGGWAGITRPVDAICYAVPIAAAMLWTMREMSPRRAAATLAAIAAGAAPFLGLLFIFSVGVSGKLFESPYHLNSELYTPHMNFGFHHFDAGVRPQTTLPQRIEFYDSFIVPAAIKHTPDRLWNTWMIDRFPLIAHSALPSEWLLILIPPGLVLLRGPRVIFAAAFALFVGFYACFLFLLQHYPIPFAPALIICVLLGMEAIVRSFPSTREWLTTLLTVGVMLLTLRAIPHSAHRSLSDDPYEFPAIGFDARLPSMVQSPAIVLYRFDPAEMTRTYGVVTDPAHEEPVYNTDVAWPDNAPIVRAHDRSQKQNAILFRYYARTQPARRVYLVDRGSVSDPLYRPQYLGTVTELDKASDDTADPLYPPSEAPSHASASLLIDLAHPGPTIPGDFAGLSFEMKDVLPDQQGHHLFSAENRALIATFKALGVKSLRVGGNSADNPAFAVPATTDIDALFAFAREADVKVIYTLRLRDRYPPKAAAQLAKYIMSTYADRLLCFAIGNEPDLYASSYESYRDAFKSHLRAVSAPEAAPTASICGPGCTVTNRSWASEFARDFAPTGRLKFITQHAYPGGSGARVADAAAARADMVSAAWVIGYQTMYDTIAPVATEYALGYRIEEANSFYDAGVQDVSNSFAATLWGLEYMHWWAEHGCAGVNFHTGDRVAKADELVPCQYAVFSPSAQGYRINPLGYAIKAFHLGGQGQVIPVTVRGGDRFDLAAYGVLDGHGDLLLTLINKGRGPSPHHVTLSLERAQHFTRCEMMFLASRGSDLAATSGIMLGDAEILEDASWEGKWTLVAGSQPARDFVIDLPAATAVVVRLKP